jgi:hypothetical protein
MSTPKFFYLYCNLLKQLKLMNKFFIFSLLNILASLCNHANAQSLAWAKQMGGAGNGAATSVAVDASGNVYTTGSFSGTADFDPGTGIYNLTSFATYGDIFVSKLDASGNFIWAKQLGGATFIASATSIAVDTDGNVYTTGDFSGTIDFDPGPGTYNLMAPGTYDVFVSKLDSAGNFVWAKQFLAEDDNTDYGYSIALNESGHVYVTGSFSGTTDFDPGPGTYNLSTAGNNDCFISKLDASGNFVWAKKMGGTANDGSHSLALDNSGNIYTTGWFIGTADFDPGIGTFNLSTSSWSDVDIFVCKLDSSGNFIWAKRMGGTTEHNQNGISIAVDANANVYTTGEFMGTADFDPGTGTYNLSAIAGNYDIFVSKLDSSGNFLWAKQMGGPLYDVGRGIAVDAGGIAYTTGYFNNSTADFDPDTSATYYLTSFGMTDGFISKLDSSGDFLWAGQLGGPEYDYGRGIAVDAGGNIYAAGDFSSTADLDPGTGTYYLTCPGFGGNIFVVKLDPDFSTSTDEHLQASFISTLEIFPNPSTGILNVQWHDHITGRQMQSAELNICNSLGELVCSKPLQTGRNEIDLSSAGKGVYFLKVQAGSTIETKRVSLIK